jgi:hypothetical protein
LSSRGIRVTAIVLDPASFGASYGSLETEIELTASHIPHYVVRFGDELAEVLTNEQLRSYV